jgi:hypothetical protein
LSHNVNETVGVGSAFRRRGSTVLAAAARRMRLCGRGSDRGDVGDRLIAGEQIGDSDVSAVTAAQAVGSVVTAPIVLFTGGPGN